MGIYYIITKKLQNKVKMFQNNRSELRIFMLC